MLFPTGAEPRPAARGTFSCPSCTGQHPYTRVVVGRVVRVFAIRLPAGTYGEYIECGTCLSTYRPAALALQSDRDHVRVAAEYERALLRVLALLVVSDGHIHEAEIETVRDLLRWASTAEAGFVRLRGRGARSCAHRGLVARLPGQRRRAVGPQG